MTSWTEGRELVLRDMWARHCSTIEIASVIGVSRNAVIGKARRLGLPAHANAMQGRYDYEEFKRLYDAGCNDCEIARQTGASTSAVVFGWRCRNGLPRHPRKSKACAADMLVLREAGMTLQQIADRFGYLTPGSVWNALRRYRGGAAA